METVLSRLAEQLPVAVLFAVFVIYWTDRIEKSQERRDEIMRSFWAEQQGQMREIYRSIVETLETHDHRSAEHARETSDAITAMKERTRPVPKRRSINAKTE